MRLWLCEWLKSLQSTCWIPTEVVRALCGCYMAGATWNCCRLGAGSVYTTHNHAPVYSVTLFEATYIYVCLAATCHLHFWAVNHPSSSSQHNDWVSVRKTPDSYSHVCLTNWNLADPEDDTLRPQFDSIPLRVSSFFKTCGLWTLSTVTLPNTVNKNVTTALVAAYLNIFFLTPSLLCKISELKDAWTLNSIFSGPITHLLSVLCGLMKILSRCQCEKRKTKRLKGFRFLTFISVFKWHHGSEGVNQCRSHCGGGSVALRIVSLISHLMGSLSLPVSK